MTRCIACILLTAFLAPARVDAQVVVRDDLGRSVRLLHPARRIVSLAPSITETLFAVGAGDQACGVTDYCTYPEAALHKSHVGGMTPPSVESIAGLEPDLIIVSMGGNTRHDFDRLTQLGIPVFVSNPWTLDDIGRSIGQIGELTGHAENAARLNRALRAREDSLHVRSDVPPVRAILFISFEPLIAAGRNTFIDDLLRRAGTENLTARATGTYPVLSRESMFERHPDVIVVTSDLVPDTAFLLKQFPEWARRYAHRPSLPNRS